MEGQATPVPGPPSRVLARPLTRGRVCGSDSCYVATQWSWSWRIVAGTALRLARAAQTRGGFQSIASRTQLTKPTRVCLSEAHNTSLPLRVVGYINRFGPHDTPLPIAHTIHCGFVHTKIHHSSAGGRGGSASEAGHGWQWATVGDSLVRRAYIAAQPEERMYGMCCPGGSVLSGVLSP